MPGKRKRLPIRLSEPIPRRTISTSAPTCSQKLAISFMKEILVAKNAFAAYFVNSALLSSMKRIGLPWRVKGLYSSSMISRALLLVVPTTTRSGFKKSSTAKPSRRNSGLETTSYCSFAFVATAAFTSSQVPTGTVLLSTITL